MTRRISSSRPMTGSSLPARASAVRSRPYFSSAAYVPSGFWRGDALAAADALERLEDRLLAGGVALEQGLRLAADLGDAEEQVLGRDVLVAEAPGLGLGALDDPAWRAGRGVSEPPWIRARLARIAASSPRKPGRSTPSRRSVSAGTPSSGSMSADRMCSASRSGLSSRWAVAWAATIASWAFWVNRSSCMSSLSWSSVTRVSAGRVGRRARRSARPRPSPRRTGRSAGRPWP